MVIQKQDTIYIHDSIVIYQYRDRWRTDTLYCNRTDTTTIINTEIVEKPIPKFIRNSAISLWIVIALAIVWVIIKIAKGKIPIINLLSKLR